MVATRERQAHTRTPAPRNRRTRWGVLLLLGGLLLWAHGCHGDEDNELWARLWHTATLGPGASR